MHVTGSEQGCSQRHHERKRGGGDEGQDGQDEGQQVSWRKMCTRLQKYNYYKNQTLGYCYSLLSFPPPPEDLNAWRTGQRDLGHGKRCTGSLYNKFCCNNGSTERNNQIVVQVWISETQCCGHHGQGRRDRPVEQEELTGG